MAKRKKQKEDDHIDESWLIPYADILTLLLALFIVLFASSSVDAQKFQMMSNAFNAVFSGGSGVMDYSNPVTQETMSELDEKKDKLNGLGKEDREELSEMEKNISKYIEDNNLQNKVETSLSGEGLLLRIRDNVLFDSGVAEIRENDEKAAREISNLLLMDLPRNVIISGHTDNVPISTAEFDSNWELSAMRAVNFMKIILDNQQLDPRLFSAKGYGEYQPIAANDKPEGRSKNRRVEILILPQGTKENDLQQNKAPVQAE